MTMEHCFAGNSNMDVSSFLAFQDLTLLKTDASPDELLQLLALAKAHQPAAICVYPQQLQLFSSLNTVKKACVVNFPEALLSAEQIIEEINTALAFNADEIDYVFPYQLYFDKPLEALTQSQNILHYCQKHSLVTKVIIETGAFHSLELLYTLALQLIEQGWDFLKTSTGKIAEGATPAKAFALLAAIADAEKPCGIKLSGGIRTVMQAQLYLNMAETMLKKSANATWFRLGTSKLLTAP